MKISDCSWQRQKYARPKTYLASYVIDIHSQISNFGVNRTFYVSRITEATVDVYRGPHQTLCIVLDNF